MAYLVLPLLLAEVYYWDMCSIDQPFLAAETSQLMCAMSRIAPYRSHVLSRGYNARSSPTQTTDA